MVNNKSSTILLNTLTVQLSGRFFLLPDIEAY